MRFFNRMMFARTLCVALALFVFGGVPEVLAQAKVPKVKITGQPVSRTVEIGQAVVFTVAYSSTTPVTLQWRRNRVPLEGATEASYMIDEAMPSDAAKYDVVVTNGAGPVTSKAATLAVNLAPASLAADMDIYGSFNIRIGRESYASEGAFVITGANTLQDPESPGDSYTFSYTRLPKNKARLVINGSFYDAELGGNITSVETHTLTFVGIAPNGRLVATSSMKGYMLPPAGYVQKKLNFSGSGAMAIETENSGDWAYGSTLGGSLTIGGSGGPTIPVSPGGSTGELTLNGGTINPDGSLTFGSLPPGFVLNP
jgi:hypothetical protein